jgi:hypothetical protein
MQITTAPSNRTRPMAESLLLKWGTIKGWDDFTEKSQEIVGRYFADGMCMSAAADKPDATRKVILCELIDQLDGEIQNDWSGEIMSKEAAKKYVMEYRA